MNELDVQSAIAVVGMSGRFPGAASLDEFWTNLRQGRESIRRFSPEELRAAGVPVEHVNDPAWVFTRPCVDQPLHFDAGFFGYPDRVARDLDPQHRVFLEVVVEALEHAGYDPERYRGWIGLYAGCHQNTYQQASWTTDPSLSWSEALQVLVSSDKDYLATRVAYKLNFRGPCLTIQTACSTGLVVVNAACHALLSFQCDMALAGAVALEFPTVRGYRYEPTGMRSPDGRCRPFDAGANGTIFGEGAGVVVLKRLEDALRDGDTIYAVVRGSAVNNDGSAKVGFSAPSVEGQAAVIDLALQVAGVPPDSISFVEAHGTGTPLGDPIELAALRRVFGGRRPKGSECALGSVKSNIGHAGTAAGIASFLKTVLALHEKELPPTLHFRAPNPKLELEQSPFYVPTELRPWTATGPRRAGVSSFGIGGTNAHAVLEEAPPEAVVDDVSRARLPALPGELLVLSAKTASAFGEVRRRLAAHLEQRSQLALADVAHTLRVGRGEGPVRSWITAESGAHAAAQLRVDSAPRVVRAASRLVFLLPGQGTQHPGMGRELYEAYPEYRSHFDFAVEHLRRAQGIDLKPLLLTRAPSESDRLRLRETELAQPALFVVEYCVARLLESWGVVADALLGHSLGEITGACLAGVFELEEALDLVAERGRLAQGLPPGAMLAVRAAQDFVEARLVPGTAVAAVNAPTQIVVAGEPRAIEGLAQRFEREGVLARALDTTRAFHSPLVEPALAEYERVVARMTLRAPKIPVFSGVTGARLRAEEARDPGYWAREMRLPVLFASGVRALLDEGHDSFIEVGPGTALSNLVGHQAGVAVSVLRTLWKWGEVTATHPLWDALGAAWSRGANIDWERVQGARRARRVALPTSPFERRAYALEPTSAVALRKEALLEPADSTESTSDLAFLRLVPERLIERKEAELNGQVVLLVGAASSLTSELKEAFERRGALVVSVSSAPELAPLREQLGFHAPIHSFEAAERVVRTLLGQGRSPSRLVLVALDEADEAVPLVHTWIRAQVQAAQGGSFHLDLVTRGAASVVGEGEWEPAHAACVGLARSLAMEMPGVTMRVLDLPCAQAEQPSQALRARLERAVFATDSNEPLVLVRERACFRLTQEEFPEPTEALPRLRSGGVYLLSGGLRGLAGELACHLLRRWNARVGILSRSGWGEAAPPTAEGEAPARARPPSRCAELEELVRHGAEVSVFVGDVRDADFVGSAAEQIRQRWGRIDGIFHLANAEVGGLFALREPADVASVIDTKLAGARRLAEVAGKGPLDCFVLFSSSTGWTGMAGSADYAAANCALDAFAELCRAELSLPALSIAWGGWEQVGMAARAGLTKPKMPAEGPRGSGRGIHPLLDEQGAARDSSSKRFIKRFDVREDWTVAEHRWGELPVVPGTAFLEMAAAAFRGGDGRSSAESIEISSARFVAPCTLTEPQRAVELLLLAQEREATFVARGGDDTFCEGRIAPATRPSTAAWDWDGLCRRCTPAPAGALHVDGWGPRWQLIEWLARSEDEVAARLVVPARFREELGRFTLYPPLLDVATALSSLLALDDRVYLPAKYARLVCHAALPEEVRVHVRRRASNATEELVTDAVLARPNGEVLVVVEGFSMSRTGRRQGGPKRPGITPERGFEALERLLAADVGACAGVVRRAGVTALGTPNVAAQSPDGSEDRRRQPPRVEHPAAAPLAAISSALEAHLRRLFCQVLERGDVDPEANFFEMGGDSLLAFQLAGRAQQEGIALTARDILERPTLAALARALESEVTAARAATQKSPPSFEEVTIPLTTHQRWFFESSYFEEPSRWNMAAVLTPRTRLDVSTLERALAVLVARHEICRVAFVRHSTGWEQRVLRSEDVQGRFFRRAAFAGAPPEEQDAHVRRVTRQVQDEWTLEQGCLLRVVHFDFGADQPERVLLVAHHVIIDAYCLGLFLSELEAVHGALFAGRPVHEDESKTSFQRAARRLHAHASSAEFLASQHHYRALPWDRCGRLPRDFELEMPENTVDSGRDTELRLDRPRTTRLVEAARARHGLQLADLLLGLWVDVLLEWSTAAALPVKVMNSGRFPLLGEGSDDLSRVLGPFAFGGLCVFQASPASRTEERACDYARQFRQQPGGGMGAEMLIRHAPAAELSSLLREQMAKNEVLFNYYRRPSLEALQLFGAMESIVEGTRNPSDRRPDVLEITVVHAESELIVRLGTSDNLHRPETARALLRRFESALQEFCGGAERPAWKSADEREPPASSPLPTGAKASVRV